jgi:tetratricopeptide (TPR) repeat protein
LAALRRGLQLDSNRAEGYYNLGLVHRAMGQLELAINAYREAVRLNPRMYDAHYNLGNIFLEKEQLALAIVHYRSALEIRPDWQKGRNALAVAVAQQKGREGSDRAGDSGPPTPTSSQLDPSRMLDANDHGKLLRELHDTIVDTDAKSQALLELLQKQVEEAIRELSICILTPKDQKYNLEDQIQRFDEVMTQLQEIQSTMQKRVMKAKLIGEQIAKI